MDDDGAAPEDAADEEEGDVGGVLEGGVCSDLGDREFMD